MDFNQNDIQSIKDSVTANIEDFTAKNETFDKRKEKYLKGGIFIDSIKSLLINVLLNSISPYIIHEIIFKATNRDIINPHSTLSFFLRLCYEKSKV